MASPPDCPDGSFGTAAELAAVLDRLPVLVAYVDCDLRYRFVNATYRDWFGIEPRVLIGRTMLDVLGEDAFQALKPRTDAALRGEVVRFEHDVPYRAGTRWVEAVYTPHLENGSVCGFVAIVSDESARRRAEHAARAERENLHRLFEQAPAAIAILEGPDLTYRLSNSLNQKLAGHRELLGRPLREALPDFPQLIELAETVVRTGEPFVTNEIPAVLDAGREAYLAGTYQPLRDAGGNVTGLMAFAYEVTEQVHARKHAEAEERSFRAVADVAPAIVWRTNAAGVPDFYNHGWTKATGQPIDDPRTIDARSFVHPDDRAGMDAGWNERHARGEPWEAEYRLRGPDGHYRWFLGRTVPFRDDTGAVVAWYGAALDIDEQKRAQARLAFLAQASTLMGSSLDPVTLLQNVTDLVVPEYADGCAVHLRAYEENDELTAATHVEPVEPESLRAIATSDDASLEASHGSGRVLRVPLSVHERTLGLLTLVGRPARPAFGAADIELACELGRRVSTAIDNARLFETARRERARSEEASRLKDEFLAMVSHELRSPLNSILGWTTILRGRKLGEEKEARALDTIERNARAQAQLIEDLLDITRITSGKLRLRIGVVDLLTVVESAVATMRPACEAKGIHIETRVDDALAPISGDAERLEQVVWNLVSNAVKFSERGSRITIEASPMRSDVVVRVIDTGRGIAPDFLPHVFERFRQGEGGTTRSKGGLGLGLTIVKHLVELHGGSVEATSAGLGEGATFVVTLPVQTASDADVVTRPRLRPLGPSIREAPRGLRGLRAVVVDDEAEAREILVAALEHAGISARAVGSAREALDAVRADPPDVIVSDIGMPDEDGYMLMQRVRSLPEHEGGRTPAVALTAYARMEDRTKALLSGFNMHVAKPIDPAELLVVLATVTNRLTGDST